MDTETIRSSLFTRQQIAQLTSIDDSSLNYWMREGLLVPSQGGSGRGSHRRFDFAQVNIAIVYGQLRRFGVNVASLRSLADLLQRAVQLGSAATLDVSNYTTAAEIATKLDKFRSGEVVEVEPNWARLGDEPKGLSRNDRTEWLHEKRPATDEQDLLSHFFRLEPDYDSLEAIAVAADSIGPGRELEAKIFTDLAADILRPGYSSEVTWLLGLMPDGSWDVESGSEGRFFENIHSRAPGDFGSGIFIPLGALLRRVWDLKSPAQLRRESQARYAEERLRAAGFEVKVYPADEDDGPMKVEYDQTTITLEQIEEVLARRPWLERKDAAS